MLLRLQLKQTVDSSLNSIRSLLYHHYPTIDSEQAKTLKKKANQREEQRSSDGESDQEDMETNDSTDIAPAEGERGEESIMGDSAAVVVTVHQAVTQTLDFLKPFLEELHSEHSPSKVQMVHYVNN